MFKSKSLYGLSLRACSGIFSVSLHALPPKGGTTYAFAPLAGRAWLWSVPIEFFIAVPYKFIAHLVAEASAIASNRKIDIAHMPVWHVQAHAEACAEACSFAGLAS